MSEEKLTIRLLFVDDGSYRHEDIRIPAGSMENYDRLIDLLQEEPSVLRETYVDLDRLCAAHLLTD